MSSTREDELCRLELGYEGQAARWQMSVVVKYGDVGDHEDRRALEAFLVAVLQVMAYVLVKKPTTKLAWEAITQMCVGSDRARRSTL